MRTQAKCRIFMRQILRCSREKVGCRRCQQRGIRCVYDAQRSRGGGNSKQQEGGSAESDRPETPSGHESSDQQPESVPRGSVRPGDDDGLSTIQVAIPSTAAAPRQHTRDQQASSGSDDGSRSSGTNRTNSNFAPPNRPPYQQESSHQDACQGVAGTGIQPVVAPCSEDPDPGLFFDFTEEYLDNPHESFGKLLDPFDADALLSHTHMPVSNSSSNSALTQISEFSSKKRSPGGSIRPFSHESSKQQSFTPSDQAMRTSSSKSSSVSNSRSKPSDSTRAPSSSPSRNGMDIDTDSYDDSNNSYDDGDCECSEGFLEILQEVVIPPVGADWAMAENTIFLLKNNISRCLVLSQCRGCRQDSKIGMLTLITYEKLTARFEEVAQWWGKHGQAQDVQSYDCSQTERRQYQQQQQQQHKQHKQQKLSGSKDIQRQPWITMGRYQIDTAEEHRAVFATIIASRKWSGGCICNMEKE
ncbi:hypothetical protein CGCF413_v010331 [Colletotrichum fructicola]|nr:hypothetical protein CGCF413_v010331 [Colletotrichum fructicola]